MIKLTLNNEIITALIDTGSTTSILDRNKLLQYPRRTLCHPLSFASLNSKSLITQEIITDLPLEFKEDATMSWKLTSFNNKSFDAIIGQNILKPLNALIDFYHNTITINNNTIQFQNSSPYSDEANQIEPIKIDDRIQRILFNDLNQEESNALTKILSRFKTLIFLEGQCLSNTNIIEHQIKTVVDKPLYCKIYRYPQIHEQEIYKQIEEMLQQGIIRKSNSPYNAPLWLVPKKADNSGKKKWRIVIDYRKLNENTVDDKFPIPNIESILGKLGRAQYFSTIDLAKGFHQILVQEQDREKTAFSTPHGHYEFNRMPFGLKNAPATFQRLINTVLKEEINRICVVYLDDVLIFSTSFSEHVGHIHTIFKKLSEANLKIQINKCNFFSKETQFLGHVLTPEGVRPNPTKVNSILQIKIPKNVKQIRAFLGITGYYRKFIKDFSQVAYPLIKCLKKDAKIDVNEPNFMIAFDKLKRIITEAPVLKYPDFKKKFQLITDASNIALGAVLQQDGHPICYASRTLNDHEKNYSSIQKELLAIVWATAYFRPYLYGVKFDILSDHQPLKWLLIKYNGKELNETLYRWLVKLSEFNINVSYIKGKNNQVADFLSRISNDEICAVNITKSCSSLENNVDDVSTQHTQAEDFVDTPILGNLETVVNRFKIQIILTDKKTMEFEYKNRNKKIYLNLNDLENGMEEILKNHIIKGKVGIFSEYNDHQYNKFQQKIIQIFEGNKNVKFVKCSFHAKDIENEEDVYKEIERFHKYYTGHSGINENYQSLKQIIYFPKLQHYIQKYINNCDICNRCKYDRNPVKEKFKYTETPTDIRKIVHMDIYTNSKCNFLTFIDRFSKFATAFYLEDRNNQTIIEKMRLYKSQRGSFEKLITDNEFNSVNIKEYLRNENIEVHFVKPNSHTGNADVERFHNTLTEKIRIIYLENKDLSIKDKVSKAIEYYNNSYHSTIQDTPMNIEYGNCDKKIIHNNILKYKKHYITSVNQTRENFEETRNEGYIKNYKSLRHKNEPKYRKFNLSNVHSSNIKRKKKYQTST